MKGNDLKMMGGRKYSRRIMSSILIVVVTAGSNLTVVSDEKTANSGVVMALKYEMTLQSGDYLNSVQADGFSALKAIAVAADDCLTMPAKKLFSEHTIQAREFVIPEKVEQISAISSDGNSYNYVYNVQDDVLLSATIRKPDGGVVELTFARQLRPECTFVTYGLYSAGESQRGIIVDYYAGTGKPRFSIPIATEQVDLSEEVQVYAWNLSGNLVVEGIFPISATPVQAFQNVVARLAPEQLDSLGITLSERLRVGRAFQKMEPGFRRAAENWMWWAENLIDAKDGDVRDAIRTRTLERIEQGERTVEVLNGKTDDEIVLVRERDTDLLLCASVGSLLMRFNVGKIQSVSCGFVPGNYGSNIGWLVMVYPGINSLRMVVDVSGDSMDEIISTRRVRLWSPEGEIQLDTELDSVASVDGVFTVVESSLTPEMVSFVRWQGLSSEAASFEPCRWVGQGK